MVFDEVESRVTVPNISIGNSDYTIAFWIRLSQLGEFRIFRLSRRWELLFLNINASYVRACRELSFEIWICMDVGRFRFDLRNSWTHIAATSEQDDVKIFFNGEPSKFEDSFISPPFNYIYGNETTVPQETLVIRYISRPLIMDLDIFGFALPPDEIYDLYRG